MPIDVVRVTKVETFEGSGFWTIKGQDATGWWQTYGTNKPWIASLCDRARLTGQRVIVSWRETRTWGQDIVDVHLEDTQVSA
jgi:hypothetical protein